MNSLPVNLKRAHHKQLLNTIEHWSYEWDEELGELYHPREQDVDLYFVPEKAAQMLISVLSEKDEKTWLAIGPFLIREEEDKDKSPFESTFIFLWATNERTPPAELSSTRIPPREYCIVDAAKWIMDFLDEDDEEFSRVFLFHRR